MSESEGKCRVCSTSCSARCSFCRLVYYCSRDHQKEDWSNHKEKCTRKKFKVDRNEKLGRFLVATEKIDAGNVIFKDKALMVAPKVGLLDTEERLCVGCFKILGNSDSSDSSDGGMNGSSSGRDGTGYCVKCNLPACSKACASRYFHRNFECKLLREAKEARDKMEEGEEDGACAEKVQENVLQNLLYFRCLLLKHVDVDVWNVMMTLQSNAAYREDLGNLEKTTRIFEEIKNTLSIIKHPEVKTVSKPDLHNILGIIDTNGIDVKISSSMEATCLFPTFSMMEYSCIPSTKLVFVPSTPGNPHKNSNYDLCVRSAVTLEPGDHLTCTVTNVLWNTLKRREELKKNKYFWCECPRCTDPMELGSNFSTILCPLANCKGASIPVPKQEGGSSGGGEESTNLMSPKVSTDREFQWQCRKCGKTCETWQVKKVDSQLSEAVGKLSSKASVATYKSLVGQLEELVHPDYYLTFVLNHSLIQVRGHVEDDGNQVNPLWNSKEWLEEKLEICNRLLKTIKTLDPGLAKLHIYAAVIYFEMHAIILISAGGEMDDDYKILRKQPETVKLAQIYLQKCIECFQYELLYCPEVKLRTLAKKKLEYLNMLLKHSQK